MSLPDPVALAVPVFVLLIVAEMVAIRLGAKGRYYWRDAGSSLALGFGNTLASALFGGLVVGMMVWLSQWRLFEVPVTWWSLALLVLLDDLLYYVFHRSAHRVRWFWASHVIHHSSRHYNLSTALRQTWTGFFSLSFLFRLPLVLIGFPVEWVIFVGAVNLVYQFWIHTEVVGRLPRWVEAVMNTPSHHRVHHATNPRYLDRNYAGMFIVWDRLFGTFEPERDDEKPRYGIIRNLSGHNPLWAAVHEWVAIARDLRAARSAAEVWRLVAGPPGWKSGETADALRAAWIRQGKG
ncbi:sterol desaturase family protein [Sandaracinobacteroides saxicola]|uniref:Sterol desaturase family protein n=1 Tax=Sandaracinobacteroides saxicola TaxID=2759707 RepID=A0A7G5IKE9_9SPHN|nr:sterol desaturase family protein [Sandaracinobacteroides saxicola]QMW23841.1 sterol desaturase family protein [Sandaracinobacteroides saxicola]